MSFSSAPYFKISKQLHGRQTPRCSQNYMASRRDLNGKLASIILCEREEEGNNNNNYNKIRHVRLTFSIEFPWHIIARFLINVFVSEATEQVVCTLLNRVILAIVVESVVGLTEKSSILKTSSRQLKPTHSLLAGHWSVFTWIRGLMEHWATCKPKSVLLFRNSCDTLLTRKDNMGMYQN